MATYYVTLGAEPSAPFDINISITGVTSGVDYVAVTNPITITPVAGQTTYSFTVQTIDDGTGDPNEDMVVTIDSASGGGLTAINVDGLANSWTTTLIEGVTTPTLNGDATETVYESGLADGTQTGLVSAPVIASGQLNPGTSPVALTIQIVDPNNAANRISLTGGTGVIDLNAPVTSIGTYTDPAGYGTITFYSDASWSYQLNNTADHTVTPNPMENIGVVVSNGTFESSAVTLTMNVVDDVVTSDAVVSGFVKNSGATTVNGFIDVQGADTAINADLTATITALGGTTFAASGQTSGGVAVYYYVDPLNPDTLVAYTDNAGGSAYNVANEGASQVKLFELIVDPATDSYQIVTTGTNPVMIDPPATTPLGINAGAQLASANYFTISNDGVNPATATASVTMPTVYGVNDFVVTDDQHYVIYEKDPKYVLMRSQNFNLDYIGTHGNQVRGCECCWAYDYGKGRVCFISPGHMITTLWNPEYVKIQQNAALWLLKKI